MAATPPKKFSYRGVQPLFEGSEFSINANETGAGMELWTANSAGPADHEGHGDVVNLDVIPRRCAASNPELGFRVWSHAPSRNDGFRISSRMTEYQS